LEWEDDIHMSWDILYKIEDNYSNFTMGKSKENELFVNGTKTDIVVPEDFTDYDKLEKELLEKNLIRKEEE